ncbi:MAG TPA: hypothetical protein VLK22_01215 [Candidatus Udaeobacter sp.]|nr:hypothetical protein [Candidatus Udaeobacter sp.]
MTKTLSLTAEKTIHDYLNLPFTGIYGVRCPYFNNSKLGQRGQLRVLIGKGSPEEIVEEAKIISTQYHKDIFDKNGVFNAHTDHPAEHEQIECIRQFLIENNLGIDCSGFVTHVLQKHFQETNNINLVKKLFITSKKNFCRWLISRLRPIEQIDVNVYANDKNTIVINDLRAIEPGDLVIMLKTGPRKTYNHILLIEEVDGNKIKYAQSRAWPSDGRYGHGVAQGFITINNPEKNLLEQTWEEKNKLNEENETYLEAKQAEVLEIRRIKF